MIIVIDAVSLEDLDAISMTINATYSLQRILIHLSSSQLPCGNSGKVYKSRHLSSNTRLFCPDSQQFTTLQSDTMSDTRCE